MKVSEFFSSLGKSLKSVAKTAVLARRTRFGKTGQGRSIIVMANGPSLAATIAGSMPVLQSNDTLSVNFAPIAPEFAQIRPKYHVLADPLFFGDESPENVKKLYEQLNKADWEMTLFVPVKFVKKVRSLVSNPFITVKGFNNIGAEGFKWLERLLYRRRLAMPRPRNVLMPAIMCAIWSGYDTIYVTGADHSWMQTISVDADNNVISVQPHFYKDGEKEQKRVDTMYRNFRLHQIVESFAIAFKSYHTLQDFAAKSNIKIYNSTPGSFIDAFPRKDLEQAR